MSSINNSASPLRVPKKSDLFRTVPGTSGNLKNTFQATQNRFAVIEASAGTGKTFTLVELILELVLEQEIPLKSILSVTFTDKATEELRSRLRAKIKDLLEAYAKNKELFRVENAEKSIGENLQKPAEKVASPEEPYWEIDTVRQERLKAALLDFDSVPVYTIHGFCRRVLREFAFENQQLFEQQRCDTKQLFPDVFRRYLQRCLLSQNTPVSQLFALYVKHTEGRLDSLEKTIAELLFKNGKFVPELPPFDIFLKEFSECWNNLLTQDHKLRGQKIANHPLRIAFEKTAINANSKNKVSRNLNQLLEILGQAHSEASIADCLPIFLSIELDTVTNPKCNKTLKSGEEYLSPKVFPEAERKWIEAVTECEKLLKSHYFSGETKKILQAWITQQILGEIRQELEQIKLEQGAFDFDDLLRLLEEQILPADNKNGIPAPLTKAVRQKYKCAIIDEFQDTDSCQWSIFRHLFLESPEHRLVVIGDPKQAIYAFRGADIFTYLQARKFFEEKTDCKPFSLQKNFRSSETLLCGLNQIFNEKLWFPQEHGIHYQKVECGNPELKLVEQTKNRRAIHLLELSPQFSISGKKIVAEKAKKIPRISVEILEQLSILIGRKFYQKNTFLQALKSVLNAEVMRANESILFDVFLDERADLATFRFAESIAFEIKKLLRKGSAKTKRPCWNDGKEKRPLREQDICVLFRKSKEGEILGKALRRQGIAFAFYKQKGLFEGREAKEILDLLEAVAHPTDRPRTAKVWLTRFLEAGIQELTQASAGSEPYDSEFLHQLREWNSLAEARKFRRFFDEVMQRTKLVERELLLGGDERTVTNYVHLFEVLNRQVMERHLDLSELIRLLRRFIDGKEDAGQDENLLRLESDREAVQLMTMHSAKGLEFPVVFLFGGFTGDKKNTIHYYHDADENPLIDLLNKKIPEEHRWQTEAEQQRLLYVAMTRAGGRLYLPYAGFLSGNSAKRVCKINGGYAILNEQLSTIREQLSIEKESPYFSYSLVGLSGTQKQTDKTAGQRKEFRKWRPPELPKTPKFLENTANPEQYFSKLRYQKRGFAVTSFSRMSRKKEAGKLFNEIPAAVIRTQTELEERRENDEAENTLISTTKPNPQDSILNSKKDSLPGGVQTGNLLHELLEYTDFSKVQKSDSPEEWLAHPEVNRSLNFLRERYGRSAETVPRIAEIVWNTLRTPVKLGKTSDAPELELANCEKNLRETDFYFPIPFRGQNTQDYRLEIGTTTEGWRVEKGFIRGSIDFLFEHRGKIYLLDWKSNLLENYHPQTVEREVLEHYELQLQIYTLATVYWFGLNSEEKYQQKFGGALYLFLRGMPENKGVFFKRPNRQELKSYENQLRLLEDY